MGNKIYKYNDITKLNSHIEFETIRKTLHICADTSVYEGMILKYGNDFLAPILPISSLIQNLLVGWDSSIIKMGQYIELTRRIKEMTEKNPDFSMLLRGIRRNQKDVLASIRLLVEANIYPEDFKPLTDEEYAFVKVWDLVDTEDSILSFRNELHYNFNDNNYFKEKLQLALREALISEQGKENIVKDADKRRLYSNWINALQYHLPKSIVLHGFYFLTPVQDRIFQLIENLGIGIIYLNCYNENYPKVFNIWEKTFSTDFGYLPVDNWVGDLSEEENLLWSNIFARIYEGQPINNIEPVNELEIIEYDEIIPFINQFDENKNYYSPDAKELNNVLREYYPERYRKKHFLSYPVGQYIFELHRMWNEDVEGLTLDIEGIQQCFASGWLFDDTKIIQAKDYIHDLRAIEPFFKGCRLIKDWEDRFDLLFSIIDEIVEPMNTKIPMENELYRYHKLLSNPFLHFSFFGVNRDRLTIIRGFVGQIMENAKDLFNQNKEINLKDHLEKIRNLLEENSPIDLIYEEEKEIIRELRARLTLDFEYFTTCFPEDIAEALIIFLGGEFEEDDDDQKLDKIVLPFTKIEAEPLINDNRVLHACQLNEDVLPGNIQSLTWPLTEKNLERIDISKRYGSRRLLDRTKIIIKDHNLISRYLFYLVLNVNSKIKLSWIKNWDNRELNQSIFIQLLKMWNPNIKHVHIIDDFKVSDLKLEKDVTEKNVLMFDEFTNLPEEVIMEFVRCPRRFFYSYIARELPTYYSEFHHQFVFTGLLKAFNSATQKDKVDVFKELEILFPQWNLLEKQQLFEYIGSISKADYSFFDGVQYLNQRKLPHFLNQNYDEPFLDSYFTKDKMQKKTENLLFLSTQEKEKCKYCPHIEYCNNAIYPLDKEDE